MSHFYSRSRGETSMKISNFQWRKNLSRLITVIFLSIFLFAAYNLFTIFMDYYENRKVLNELQKTFYTASDEGGSDGNTTTVRRGFDQLLKQNKDVVGWITIDGTKVDYPILQAKDNKKYLTKNYYLNESRAGSIFLDYRNDITLLERQNIVIYGHRMKDGTMFQQLTKFLDKDFFDKHRFFQFDTLYDHYEAEVFSVYQTLTDFDYIQTHFSTDTEYEQFLSDLQEKSIFERNVELGPNDTIITLSTCDYALDRDKGRLVVQAKLVKKEKG